MTSEPDSTPRRRPPTIDLTAKEIETPQPQPASASDDAAASAHGAATESPPGANASGDAFGLAGRLRQQLTGAHAIGAAVGAIVIAVIFAGLWLADLLPARGDRPSAVATPAIAPSPSPAAASDQTAARLDKIEAMLAAPRPDAALGERIAATESANKALARSLAALDKRIDDAAVATRTALGRADAAAAAATASKDAAQAAVGRADLGALNDKIAAFANEAGKIAALTDEVAALSQTVKQRPAGADDRVARMAVAAEALRATVERGAPYDAELAMVTAFGADANATAALAPFAATGVPSAASLGRELAALVPELQRASGTAASGASFLGRLEAHAQNLVRVTPLDASARGDAAAVIARISIDASRGDVAAALDEIARLPEGARSVAEGWAAKARVRETALAAGRRIAAAAMAALGRSASQ